MPQKGRRPNSSTVQKKAPAPAPQPDISGPNTVDTWRGHREKYRDPCRPDDTVASVTLDQIYDETVLPTIQAHLPPINLGPLDCVTHGRNVEEVNSLWSDLMIEKLYSHRNLAVSAALIFYLHFNLGGALTQSKGKSVTPVAFGGYVTAVGPLWLISCAVLARIDPAKSARPRKPMRGK